MLTPKRAVLVTTIVLYFKSPIVYHLGCVERWEWVLLGGSGYKVREFVVSLSPLMKLVCSWHSPRALWTEYTYRPTVNTRRTTNPVQFLVDPFTEVHYTTFSFSRTYKVYNIYYISSISTVHAS